MPRFVRPERVVLRLADGDTITVKRRLNAGEQRDAFNRMYVANADGRMRANPLQSGLAIVTAYLLDWSTVDDDGQKVAIAGLSVPELEAVLNQLEPDDFTEMKEAIEAHDARERSARDEEKKVRSGKHNAEATSSSPSAPVGELIGSVN